MRLFASALLLASVSPSLVDAQATIPSEPLCRRCSIDLERTAALGTLVGGGIIPGEPESVAAAPDGSYWVAVESNREPPVRFASDGSALGKVGRSGKGPGEFAGELTLQTIRDKFVYVHDGRNMRLSVFRPTGELVRSFRLALPRLYGFTILRNGTILVNANVLTNERAGYPFHLYSSAGELIRSFGDEVFFDFRRASLTRRTILAADSGFWAIVPHTYQIQRWSAAGRKTVTLNRGSEAEWFSPHRETAEADEAPLTTVRDAYLDSNGYLWTFTTVPDTEWEDAVEFRQRPDGSTAGSIANPDEWLDTYIEVIDLEQRRVIKTARADLSFPVSPGTGLLAHMPRTLLNRIGLVKIDIYEARLSD